MGDTEEATGEWRWDVRKMVLVGGTAVNRNLQGLDGLRLALHQWLQNVFRLAELG